MRLRFLLMIFTYTVTFGRIDHFAFDSELISGWNAFRLYRNPTATLDTTFPLSYDQRHKHIESVILLWQSNCGTVTTNSAPTLCVRSNGKLAFANVVKGSFTDWPKLNLFSKMMSSRNFTTLNWHHLKQLELIWIVELAYSEGLLEPRTTLQGVVLSAKLISFVLTNVCGSDGGDFFATEQES